MIEGARRAKRPFALSKFHFDNASDAQRFVRICHARTRTCDAGRQSAADVLIVWDGTDAEGARVAARRLVESHQVGEFKCHVSTVGYPEAGFTKLALLSSLAAAPPDFVTQGTGSNAAASQRNAFRRRRGPGRHDVDRYAG